MKRGLFFVSALAFLLIGAVPSSAQLTKSAMMTQITTCFPDNNTGAITPAIQRQCLDTLVNSYQQFIGSCRHAYKRHSFDHGLRATRYL